MKANNPGIASLSTKIQTGSYSDLKAITGFASANKIDLAVSGRKISAWNNGVVAALADCGHTLRRTGKKSGPAGNVQIVTGIMVSKYNIPGNPRFKVVWRQRMAGIFLKMNWRG